MTFLYASSENSRVTLMLIPSEITWRIAGTPGSVPGILTIRFGLPTAAHSRRASTIVASVSSPR